jgi:hypothetical protein
LIEAIFDMLNEDCLLPADFYNHRIQKFAADGTFFSCFGTKGSRPGQFEHAIAVAAAADSTVFAFDFGNDRITRCRPPGP